MAPLFARFLKAEAKINLPDPDEALNIGYATHCADDPSLDGTQIQRMARDVSTKFLLTTAEPNTVESAYLSCIRGIVVSHSPG